MWFSNGKTIFFESWGLSRRAEDAQDGAQEALEGLQNSRNQGLKTGPDPTWSPKLIEKGSKPGPKKGLRLENKN